MCRVDASAGLWTRGRFSPLGVVGARPKRVISCEHHGEAAWRPRPGPVLRECSGPPASPSGLRPGAFPVFPLTHKLQCVRRHLLELPYVQE